MFGRRLNRLFGLEERTSEPACYILNHGSDLQEESTVLPCGGSSGKNTFCCAEGDICTESSICHFTHSLSGTPGTSGYYVGGCTDPTFKDPACSQQCTNFVTQDIAYNSTTGEWACCYTDTDSPLDCAHPGNDTFQAPPLLSLTQAPSYGATVSAPSATSSPRSSGVSKSTSSGPSTTPSQSTSTLPSSASSSASSTASPSSGLSSGAKAGIGVGVTIAALLILAGIIYLLFSRRRRQKEMNANMGTGNDIKTMYVPQPNHDCNNNMAEMPPTPQRQELYGKSRAELDADADAEVKGTTPRSELGTGRNSTYQQQQY